jgi:N-methylhydantoinase A
MDLRLGVDVGGTFTDVVTVDDTGRVALAKVPSTPRDQSEGVLAGWSALAAAEGADPAAVAVFAHGTTVATNALLERRGGRTALVTTEGFLDLLEIGRQERASLYDLTRPKPAPLVPRHLRFAVRERMGPQGVVVPLDPASLAATVAAVAAARVDAVAVCLLFGFLHPEHERAVGAALAAALPEASVSLSSEVLPEVREFERMSTTVADAYLRPRLGAYLRRLEGRAAVARLPEPLVMQSSGGVADAGTAARHPARFVLSGPAGGVVGASYVAGLSGHRDVLTFDMGGTSTDVAPVLAGRVQMTTESVVAGVPLRLPMVDVHTVSAGGGSVAWVDDGGALRVGPRSAGAEPGPACYGRGGTEPTVTDANLLLGLLPDGARFGGGVTVRRGLAAAALERLGAALGVSAVAAARGVVRVADTEMVRALRVISVERGLDPRDFALVAFGGAGGLHACALAEELGCRTVLVPRAAGVLSALGLAISDVRHDHVRPFPGADPEELAAAYAELEAAASAALDGARLERFADLRYAGQSFELTVPGTDAGSLVAAFHEAHERRYGHRIADEPVEIVAVRVVATREGALPDLRGRPAGPGPGAAARGGRAAAPAPRTRAVHLAGAAVTAAVHERTRMSPGDRVSGPAVVDFPEATCLVPPGWAGAVDDVGTLVLARAGSGEGVR